MRSYPSRIPSMLITIFLKLSESNLCQQIWSRIFNDKQNSKNLKKYGGSNNHWHTVKENCSSVIPWCSATSSLITATYLQMSRTHMPATPPIWQMVISSRSLIWTYLQATSTNYIIAFIASAKGILKARDSLLMNDVRGFYHFFIWNNYSHRLISSSLIPQALCHQFI